MPRSAIRLTSSIRRQRQAERLFSFGFLTMRPYFYCSSKSFPCVVAPESEHCKECFRVYRHCDLAPLSDATLERLHKQERDLAEQALEAQTKVNRLRRQRRLILKKLKDLGNQEERNLLELKMD